MTNEERFVNELIGYIFAYPDDDYMIIECLCRKLHKYGLIDKKGGVWTTNFIDRKTEPKTERKGEWTCRNPYWHTAICSNCNKVTMFEEWDGEVMEYNYCPNCGARMDGEA